MIFVNATCVLSSSLYWVSLRKNSVMTFFDNVVFWKEKNWFLNFKLAFSSHWLDLQTWWEDLWQPVQRLHAFALRSHDAVTPSKSAIITSIMVMVYLCDLQSSFHYILPTKSSFWRTIDCRSSFLRSSFSFKSCRRCSCLVNVTYLVPSC